MAKQEQGIASTRHQKGENRKQARKGATRRAPKSKTEGGRKAGMGMRGHAAAACSFAEPAHQVATELLFDREQGS
ncbi:hypothetical protein [Acidipila sp. EB88]|uniref:hypothetical protein n=1 Tax=Acidipila sp. EB88 TaxID=2305226 RepID=UPI000F5DCAEC|nr:hypothetical protein [Acidipila sp. EB88]